MKKFIIYSTLVVGLILSGCGTVKGILGKKSTALQKQETKIEQVEKKEDVLVQKTIKEISGLTYASSYSLLKVTNEIPEVKLALGFNDRSLSLSGQPDIKTINEYKIMVDGLIASNTVGSNLLKKKDLELVILQNAKAANEATLQSELDKYKKLSESIAISADTTAAELKQYESWFGLGAIWMGLKRLFVSSMWFLIIGGVLFVILRFAAASNPIAASIFSIFEHMISWIINTIKVVFPKALSIAGNVSKEVYDKTSLLLKKIVDNIQSIKEIEKRTGKDITFKEVLVELDKSLDVNEKKIIDEIKKDLGY